MHSLKAFYRPDNYPEWISWKEFIGRFTLIGKPSALGTGALPTARPGFAPRVSFGKPQDEADTTSTTRRLRRGYKFQVKLRGTGHAVIDRFRIHAQIQIENSKAK